LLCDLILRCTGHHWDLRSIPGGCKIVSYMKKGVWFLSLCACLLVWGVAWGEDARITDAVVQNTDHGLILHFRVDGCFTDDLEQAILNGVPTTFNFLTSIHRVRKYWLNKEVVSLEMTHSVKYNNLTNEFVITRSERNGNRIVVDSFDEAKSAMSEVKDLRIAGPENLEENNHYEIGIKAELSKITLPVYLHYVFRFFLFLWDFETDWYTMDLMY